MLNLSQPVLVKLSVDDSSSSNTGLIIGVVVGVGAFLLLVAGGFVLFKRRHTQAKKVHVTLDGNAVPVAAAGSAAAASGAEMVPPRKVSTSANSAWVISPQAEQNV